ncbi:Fucose 4-O-acetylase [Methylophilus rhizosphaerae]|uniref:Fucose 4-O-acetylase n=1 Tax=Methylophilus rhizosphaerae TaxID=492660 RepID=A0A1G9AW78_9PROT|nr:acyltransferase [Methylophilus rhizosphaerae]SDK30825.1 Fucose 4-O-acetylase [Methylophilus rhizosphaerae]
MRDDRIDILRFIGLAMIILAHVDPPALLFQLRNFDVPLMIVVSAMSFRVSYQKRESYLTYFWKRFKRLVLPVWFFLTVYFLALFAIDPENTDLNAHTILTSYTLLEGIGYVWIIRVFLLVAIVSPLLFHWHQNIADNCKYYGVLTVSFIAYEGLRYFALPYIQAGSGELIASALLYLIPYSLIFAIGLRMAQAKEKQLHVMALTSAGIFVLAGLILLLSHGGWLPTQALKYPPSIYYLSYAVLISSLLWMSSDFLNRFLTSTKVKPLVMFIAANSIWIYLWHIPVIKAVHTHFLLKYLIAFTVAVSVTYVQVRAVSYLLKHIHHAELRKNIKMIFTG